MPLAEAPGARLSFEATGTGTPIVFVHETAADQRSWEPQVRWFSRFHKCITYNSRGYAPSERSAEPADFRTLATDIGHVMDAAGVDQAFIVGLSMGAYFAMHFGLAHPERVCGMVLAGLGTGSDDITQFRTATRAVARAVRSQGIKAFVDQVVDSSHRVQLQNKDVRGWNEFLMHLSDLDPHGAADLMEFCHATRPPIYDFEAMLHGTKIPTLIAVGDEDTPCIPPALFLKRTIPRSGLWICPKTGHAINLEEPGLFNRAVQDFIYAVQQGAWTDRDPRSLAKTVVRVMER
ncbi:3-oxoadipate enol-lactonase [Caballeronia calidae]|uniref:3-oxoadipate enol-lactonase n=1 Tax=Caballeronia calidae TaxID=1777139 RepID=A0A158E4K5_9BURK|nr:alpha/beta hydrolase [Caballeronia calidae]SAL01821.1 3-oxoadipate enol-lactonase [Caballeronia calidae]